MDDNALKANKITKDIIKTLTIYLNFFDKIIDIFFLFKFQGFLIFFILFDLVKKTDTFSIRSHYIDFCIFIL